MAADSVGQIGLDLVVNQNQFKQQLAGIQGMAKKAGAALAAAFAVKKIVDFGAQCIELGSDLQEVQNVVDVTFPRMSRQVDKFAKDAVASFGLSETMAKKFTGTFGAMAKAFGFPEQAAYEMSTALTGLSGDVASFYNISQDEAYTKLKSVFTGETESLKDLGVVMTQAALDQYALANGFGKTTQAMTEAEKVALRYKFVTEQLSGASGDFLRTSDGWANQVRVLKLQFDSLKATIGQGLINVLTPVIKVINTIIGKLMSLANAFKAFTELVTGKKGGGGASAAVAGMEAVSGSANDASGAMAGAGGAAKKAAKDIKGASTGIDELNIVQAPDDSGSGGSGGGADGGYAADEFDMGEVDASAMEAIDSRYQGLIDKARELASLFKGGFAIAFGDTSVLDSVQESIQGIKDSLADIFTDPEVLDAAESFANRLALDLGKAAGGMASIGASMADNLFGGLDLYLNQNSQRIKDYLVSMFDIGSNVSNTVGRLSGAFGKVFESFRSKDAKQITADIVGAFSGAFMGITELGARFGADILDVITAPFIDNADLIRQTMEDTFSAIEPVFGEIQSVVDEFFTKAKETYDTYWAPMMDSMKTGLSEIATSVLNAYNQYILPVIDGMVSRFGEFRDQYLSPLIDKFMDFAGKVAEAVTAVWENCLKPFVLWFVDTMAPIIGDILSDIIDVFFIWWEGISEVLGHVLDALGGLMDFITGVFTGDWSTAWEGIRTILSSIWEAMKSIVSTITSTIKSVISSTLGSVDATWKKSWNAILTFLKSIWDNISSAISDKISIISTAISGFVDGMKQTFSGLIDFITGVFTGDWSKAWEGVKDIFKGIFNAVVSLLEDAMNFIVEGINRVLEGINDVVEAVGDVVGMELSVPTMKRISLPRLAQGGFVKANTPQLAMIGDNRHYGEIVAPEDKMQEMVDKAVAMASGNGGMTDQYLVVMIELLRKIIELIESLDLTVNIDIREIKKKLVDLEKRSGYTLKPT